MRDFEYTISDKISCFFIGNSHDFSDTLVKLAEANLEDITFYRLASIEALFALPIDRTDRVRSIILNQSMIEALKAEHSSLLERFPNAAIALAYRQPKCAQNALREIREHRPQADLSFLPMNRDVDRWLTLLQLLICGENYIPSELYVPTQTDRLKTEEGNPSSQPLLNAAVQERLNLPDPTLRPVKDELTCREMQVLTCVAEGKQNKIIADRLGLSEHTVKLHIHHVISKLGVNNRTEAAVWFLEQAKSELRQ